MNANFNLPCGLLWPSFSQKCESFYLDESNKPQKCDYIAIEICNWLTSNKITLLPTLNFMMSVRPLTVVALWHTTFPHSSLCLSYQQKMRGSTICTKTAIDFEHVSLLQCGLFWTTWSLINCNLSPSLLILVVCSIITTCCDLMLKVPILYNF